MATYYDEREFFDEEESNTNLRLVIPGISPTPKTIAEHLRSAAQRYGALNSVEATFFFRLW